MRPQFALNFAEETVSLLQRHAYGWQEHGQVALAASDTLEAQMAALRATATRLGGQGFTTKLVIPAAQILYTAIHAPGPTIAERRRQIEAALLGMTPYPVSDLVFDWSGPGKTVRVAVVARETLREAEDFAQVHGMRPVSFVALPANDAFEGEPWFGQTSSASEYLAQGEYVKADREAMVICTPEEGAANALRAEQEAAALAAAAQTDAPAPEPALPEPVLPESVLPEPVTHEVVPPEPFAPETDNAEPADMPPAEATPEEFAQEEPPHADAFDHSEPELTAPPPSAAPDHSAPLDDEPQWADEGAPSGSLAEELAVYGQEPEEPAYDDGVYDEFAESPQAAAEIIESAPEPEPQWHNNGSDRISIPESDLDRLRAEFGVDRPEEIPGAEAPLSAQISETGRSPKLQGARRDAPAAAAGASLHAERNPAQDGTAQDKAERKEGALRKPVGTASEGGPSLSRKAAEPAIDASETDEPPAKSGRISINARIGASRDAEISDLQDQGLVGGKPKHLGLMLTGVLILVIAIVAMLMGGEPETPSPQDAPDEASEQSALSPVAEAPVATASVTTEDTETAEPAREAEASSPDAAAKAAEPRAEAETGSVNLLDAPAKRDAEPVVPAPPPPYNQLARIQPDGTVTPTAEGILMPGKFMLIAGKPDRIPAARPESVEFAYTEATGKPMPYQAPSLKGKKPKLRPESVVAAAQAAAAPEAEEPAPEAAAPKATPPATQQTRPQTRPTAKPISAPAEAAPAVQEAQAEAEPPVSDPPVSNQPVSDPRVSTASPLRARPASVAEAARAEAEAARAKAEAERAAQEAMAAASAQAVTVSRRPPSKPQNFSGAVQAALAAAMASAPAPTPAAAPAPAPARSAAPRASEADDEPEARPAPALPTAASVAKAATSENAIRLNQVNLIGVSGGNNSRRALLRMPNGRFLNLRVGDSFDGGRVTAISENALTYQKGSKAYRLNLIDG